MRTGHIIQMLYYQGLCEHLPNALALVCWLSFPRALSVGKREAARANLVDAREPVDHQHPSRFAPSLVSRREGGRAPRLPLSATAAVNPRHTPRVDR